MGLRSTFSRVVKPVSRSRQLRTWTAGLRVLPDFVIIGAQRSGTTSLYKYLIQHPDVIPALKKEVHYFDYNYHRGLNWYRMHFPLRARMVIGKKKGAHSVTGEGSPYYLYHPLAHQRLAETLPEVKLIAVLRNPTDRAYSQYRMNVRKNREKFSFREAIEKELERTEQGLDDNSLQPGDDISTHKHYSYLARGRYLEQLLNWEEYYKNGRLLVLNSETMYRDPAATVNRIAEYLSISEWRLPQADVYNQGGRSEMDADFCQELAAYFRPFNQQLYDYLGQDFGWE